MHQELYEFVRLIPVSLSVGRKKVSVDDTPLLKRFIKTVKAQTTATDAQSVVEMFTPNRPS